MKIDIRHSIRHLNSIPSGRDNHLDFVKGWLVVGMVIYHVACLNDRAGNASYLNIQSTFDFVSGSWIYISGAIIAIILRKKKHC